ncbi:hypothetical protein [Bacillus proteolyticus]|uniref:hypothetical protein n=1 Tax=Bacillus proteolyticus TaxID=2026192 RepID=UPI000AE0D378|nr:hypothetical protein [Bacillus proteolyticus]
MEKCLFQICNSLATYSTARTVLSGGEDGDNFKVLPIATAQEFLRLYTKTAGN